MANYGYTRLRAPSKAQKGEVINVKTMIIHPMEGIERRSGSVLEKNYHMVYKVTGFFNDKKVVDIMPTQSISTNPFFSFPLKVTESGEIKVVVKDTFGKEVVKSKKITVE